MAFVQQISAPTQRQGHIAPEARDVEATTPEVQYAPLDDSQEWVLFSPTNARPTTQAPTASTVRTYKTVGLSKLSDFGSLSPAACSDQLEELSDNAEGIDDDDENDLNSLDDGLHAFREPSIYQTSRRLDQSGGSVLPAHDGLGTFPASSSAVQEHLWKFEKHNPVSKRLASHRWGTSSLQMRLNAVDDNDGLRAERERTERVEKWRIEQSKVLLEEIERETRRRRRMSQTSRRTDLASNASEQMLEAHTSHTTNLVEQSSARMAGPKSEENESFWQRITRRVIRDIIGLDEKTISVIFGESLPENDYSDRPSSQSSLKRPTDNLSPFAGVSWEDRLLNRLARELGMLVHQLSEQPGAFTTYTKSSTLEYAGIPVTPPSRNQRRRRSPLNVSRSRKTSASEPYFPPTLQDPQTLKPSDAGPWGIDEDEGLSAIGSAAAEHEYWEQTPNLKTVFGFLHNRFTASEEPAAKQSTKIATTQTPDSVRRTAIIRQHHPLVSRATPTVDRSETRYSRSNLLQSEKRPRAQFKRPGVSCASASTKRSRLESNGSSRNYWDLGGSIGSGSAIVATGGMGAWGEI